MTAAPLKSKVHQAEPVVSGSISPPSSGSKSKPSRKLTEIGGKLIFVQVDCSSIISVEFVLRVVSMKRDALARHIQHSHRIWIKSIFIEIEF
jgi:hypothetical protein